ncbi:MAG: uracil-DNA glycosylase [Deltaproteobacteria bacterium]|nr:uracil-DNA glycosylase [Deltaproteobacteria bacterium]
MPEDPGQELAELVSRLKEWLRYQGRLGWAGVTVAAKSRPQSEEDASQERLTLEEIRQEMGDCRRCKLWRNRTHLVFGEGSPTAALMFIGEAPGEEEDLQGRPFVGPAGQLLNNLLNKLGLSREEVYIANVVKSRPPGNREPEADEIAACFPFLEKQIRAIRPKVIVTLGRVATQTLLNTRTPLTRLRGKWQKYGHIRVMPTFHPSYLLRFPRERLKTWEDMQKVMEYLASDEKR